MRSGAGKERIVMKNFTGSDGSQNGRGVQFALRRLPWRRIFAGAGIAAAILFALFLGYVLRLVASAPDIDLITVSPVESATYICAQDGTYLRRLTLASSNRDIVTLDEIPDSLQKAVVAIEDERFYEHNGIDLRGIARAFISGIFSGSFSEGASTITQQLIKNNVFTSWTQENSFRERFSRKIQEQYLALQLEKRISKEEILEDYLNTINLGAGCYGVQAAAQRYFGKDVSELNVSESAVLAAIPQNPSRYNPVSNPEENSARRAVVLQYMAAQGYLSDEEKQSALDDDVYARIRKSDPVSGEGSAYSYYEDALIEQAVEALMDEKGFSEEQARRAVYSGGLRIFTAQDSALQQICDEEFQNPANFPEGSNLGIDYALSVMDADGQTTHYGSESLRSFVRENLDDSFDLLCSTQEEAQGYADAFRAHILESSGGQSPNDADKAGAAGSENGGCTVLGERLILTPQPQASLVLMDHATGFVRAIVGGRGEKSASLTLNRATGTTRQPGSTFKILTAYAPAINAFGQTLATLYKNEPYEYEDGTPVSNWDITDYSGTVTVREAITRSINVIAVKCITEISPRAGFEYARRFGITTLHETYESADGLSSDVIQPLALGGITQGVTNLELCGAYAAIADGGVYHAPRFFTKILDRQGNVLIDWTVPESRQVLSDSTAFLLTDAMKDVVSAPGGTAFGAIEAGAQPVAGKTGTTSNYKDIWFVGYTPFYTCCVWGGYDNSQPLPDGAHSYSKTLWSAVMNRVHEGMAASDFPVPESVRPVLLCRSSHLPAVPGGCMDTYVEYFAAGTEPEQKCPLHKAPPETERRLFSSDLFGRQQTEKAAGNEQTQENEKTTESEKARENEKNAESEKIRENEKTTGSEKIRENERNAESKKAQENEKNAESKPAQKSEQATESRSQQPASEAAQPENFQTEAQIEARSEARIDAQSETQAEVQIDPQADAQTENALPGQADTSSLEDLMNRLADSALSP